MFQNVRDAAAERAETRSWFCAPAQFPRLQNQSQDKDPSKKYCATLVPFCHLGTLCDQNDIVTKQKVLDSLLAADAAHDPGFTKKIQDFCAGRTLMGPTKKSLFDIFDLMLVVPFGSMVAEQLHCKAAYISRRHRLGDENLCVEAALAIFRDCNSVADLHPAVAEDAVSGGVDLGAVRRGAADTLRIQHAVTRAYKMSGETKDFAWWTKEADSHRPALVEMARDSALPVCDVFESMRDKREALAVEAATKRLVQQIANAREASESLLSARFSRQNSVSMMKHLIQNELCTEPQRAVHPTFPMNTDHRVYRSVSAKQARHGVIRCSSGVRKGGKRS